MFFFAFFYPFEFVSALNDIIFNQGMTEVLRPSLYGAQHPIVVLKETQEEEDYIVVGHCCESVR